MHLKYKSTNYLQICQQFFAVPQLDQTLTYMKGIGIEYNICIPLYRCSVLKWKNWIQRAIM